MNDGFEEFFDEHYSEVRRALTLALGDGEAAEEAAQEGFARAYTHWRRVRSMERPVAWVYVVSVNAGRDDGRRLHRRRLAHGRAQTTSTAALPFDETVTAAIDVDAALGSLPPRQRLAVVLRYLADLSIGEVARAMKCSPGTVKSTVHAALRHLRVDLEETNHECR